MPLSFIRPYITQMQMVNKKNSLCFYFLTNSRQTIKFQFVMMMLCATYNIIFPAANYPYWVKTKEIQFLVDVTNTMRRRVVVRVVGGVHGHAARALPQLLSPNVQARRLCRWQNGRF